MTESPSPSSGTLYTCTSPKLRSQKHEYKKGNVSKDDETTDSDNVKLGVDEKYHREIRNMLRNHNELWSARLGNVNILQHRIDPIPGAHPLKSTLNNAGPKTEQLEQFEIFQQLKVGVIEHFVSKLSAPVLFATKNIGVSVSMLNIVI